MVLCGGGASRVFDNIGDNHRYPIVSYPGTTSDGDLGQIRSDIRGYRVVMLFCIMGKEVGAPLAREIISCARDEGCRVVSIIGIPFEWEAKERRQRAFRTQSDLTSVSDCSFIFDLQKSIPESKTRAVTAIFRVIDRSLIYIMNVLADAMEGPFFSTFDKGLYSITLCNDLRESWDMTESEDIRAADSAVIMVAANTRHSFTEDLSDHLMNEYGVDARFMRRTDEDDSKILILRAMRSF